MRGRVADFAFVDEDGRVEPGREPFDTDGHGTHTGAIVTRTCAAAQLYCATVIEGGRVPLRMLMGLAWLRDKPIRVLHLPLGIDEPTPVLRDVIRGFVRRGVLVVAAAGNRGSGRIDTPACYSGVLAVGAHEASGEVAVFSGSQLEAGSERCRKPEVLAPGVEVRSARRGGGWERRSGTSMASASVAGLAAALFAVRPGATAGRVAAAIQRSARPSAAELAHRVRAGCVDPKAAHRLLARRQLTRRPPCRPLDWASHPRTDALLDRRLRLGLSGPTEAIVTAARAESLAALQSKHRRLAWSPLPGRRQALVRGSPSAIRALLSDREVLHLASTELDVGSWSPWG